MSSAMKAAQACNEVPAVAQRALRDKGGILGVIDGFRRTVSPGLDEETRRKLGQFLSPLPVAEFMASLFRGRYGDLRLLDAGAGAGILSAAVVHRYLGGVPRPRTISVVAYEIDPEMLTYLRRTYDLCAVQCREAGVDFCSEIRTQDFIEAAARGAAADLFATAPPPFNAAIVNPPYGKIAGQSRSRSLLRTAGIETGNLYTAFVALIVRLLDRAGELVSVTPRSFCNGPYFQPFREMFLREMSLRQVHVYDSRSTAFRDDDVLQENVVVHAVKSRTTPTTVVVSTSSGEPGARVVRRRLPYTDVVSSSDPHLFIHLPTRKEHAEARAEMSRLGVPLEALGVNVSTGRVVDFRAREFLVSAPEPGTCPLIHPCHFGGLFVAWPKLKWRKPNAIRDLAATRDLLIPAEIYVLVKRFTSKEERRRVVACVYDPARVPGEKVGFENHLNYFHATGRGLPMDLARGLWAFLNSTPVDLYLRQFNGHTQVNATDLRSLKYPTRQQIERLGRAVPDAGLQQGPLDDLVRKELL